MKRPGNISMTLAGLLLTALLAASCAKIRTMPDTTPQEIAMKCLETGTALPQSKAASDLPETASFGVFAYVTETAGSTPWCEAWPAVADASPYLSDVAFGNIASSWVGCDFDAEGHKTHHPYYYPLSGSLLFAGYSPHHTQSDGTITGVELIPNGDNNNPYFRIEFTHLVTDKKADMNKMPDLMWFDVKDANSGKTVAKTSEAINVTFRHALSKVTFKFLDSQSYYKLKSVAIKDCIYESVFYSGNTAGWMPDISALADYELPIQSETVLNNWQSGELFFIPQYLDGVFPVLGSGSLDSGVDVILSFTVTDGFGEQTVELPLKDYTPRWEMGKHYHYNVTVNADPIDFGAPSISITQQVVSM